MEMLSEDDPAEVNNERLRSVFQRMPLTVSVSSVNAAISAGFLGSVPGSGLSALWVGAIVAVSVVRGFGARAMLRRTWVGSQRPKALFGIVGSLVNGVLWGVGASLLCPPGEAYQLFMALAIGGMCAGAVTVSASHWPTLLAFVLPSSLPLSAAFFLQGPPWQVSSAMVFIFALSMAFLGLCAHRSFGDGIRLRIALRTEQGKLREANEMLQIEMAQRRTVEATLHQAQKMEAIGHLTGGIAHDFNNLLQVMIGNLNLIKRLSADNERVVSYAVTAEKAAMRGAELTTSLLTFARRQVLQATRVNLNTLLTEFEPILLRALGAAVQCRLELAPDLPDCYADSTHFQSAVLNLVINARDAMPNGGRLLIATRRATLGSAELTGNPDAVPGEFVGVSVRDTGVGMTDAVLARVFEPFFTTKEAGKGSGLGLSQIYGFARQSGGHIQLISKPEKGTEAILWLPVASKNADGENDTSRAPNDSTI